MDQYGISQCIENLEEFTKLEIKEILKKDSEILIPGRIKFKIKDDKELANFTYQTRSSLKVYKFITNFKFKDLEDLEKQIEKIKFPEIQDPFAIKCERKGEHEFSSTDIQIAFANVINKDNKLKVNLNDPKTIVLIDIVENNCIVGIDFSGINLSKRDYRVKITSTSTNPCLAYCMLRIADISEKEIILDPFSKSGEIPIEAVLFLKNISPQKNQLEKLAFTKLIDFKEENKINKKELNIHAVDSLFLNLKSSEINAKIAGINKEINFSRQDLEWLDIKFQKQSVDKIVTFPIHATRTISKNKVDKILKEFFHQVNFLLKDKGSLTILASNNKEIEKYSSEYKLKKQKEYKIKYMNQDFYILVFKR